MAVYSTLAAVDLGSNSFHLQVRCVVGDRIHPLDAPRGFDLHGARAIGTNTLRVAKNAAGFLKRAEGIPQPSARVTHRARHNPHVKSQGLTRGDHRSLGSWTRIVAGMRNHPYTDRSQFDEALALEKIALPLHQAGLETAFP